MSSPTPLFPRLPASQRAILETLERQRRIRQWKWLGWTITFAIPVVIVLLFGLKKPISSTGMYMLVLAVGVLFGGFAFNTFFFTDENDMNEKYRRTILPLLVHDALPEWKSASEHELTLADIVGTGLFRDQANQVLKEDFFTGPAGSATAKVYEVTIEAKTLRYGGGSRYSSGHYYLDTSVGFYGYFFYLTPVKEFASRCWIFPRRRKKHGTAEDWIEITEDKYEHMAGMSTVRMGNEAFDHEFIVFSDHPQTTMRELSLPIQENILAANSIFPTSSAFSFSGHHLYAMSGFADDPLNVVKGMDITSEIENDHRNELLKMKRFVEILGRA